ncbi:MAG: sugar phosphate isomerase/epimerase family protein [Armatimonadota bacterium]|nr:sugar phosphate isomerase/epimerase family protein [Armatimonadota bacterium]
MVKSISFWSFPEGTDIEGCMKMAKRYGFEGIELTVEAEGEITADSSPADMARFVDMAGDIGLQLRTLATGLGWDFPCCGPDPDVASKGQDIVRTCLELADALGAETILVVPCTVTADYPYDRAYDDVVQTFKNLGDEAADVGVCIGLEYVWNKFLLSPLEFARIIDEIDREYVQAYFDVGNVIPNGFPDQWIRILGERIEAVHVKDFRESIGTGSFDGFVDLLEGDVAWDAVMDALGEIGYDGPITAEMMPPYPYHPERLIEATSRSMDAILGR